MCPSPYVATYDRIGLAYAANRQPDPRWAEQIHRALGASNPILNVGAGTGSYEPAGRPTIAVEPSAVMLSQRPPSAAPAVRAVAEALPFSSHLFGASLAVLTIHHWHDVDAGLREMRRVSQRQVIVTWNPAQTTHLWLVKEYLPELVEYELALDPIDAPHRVLHVTKVEPLPVPADCTDGFMAAYWRRPAAYLDARVRASISALNLLDQELVEQAMSRLADDLETGSWHRRHGDLLELTELDLGYKLVIAEQ